MLLLVCLHVLVYAFLPLCLPVKACSTAGNATVHMFVCGDGGVRGNTTAVALPTESAFEDR